METIIIDGKPTQALFGGMDARLPDLLTPGTLETAINVVWRDGQLQTRPGLSGQLSVPGSGIGTGIPYRAPDGTDYALVAAGTGIYRWQKGGTSLTLVSGAVVFTRSKVQFESFDNYIIITGANDGNLYRYSVAGAAFESAMGLARPTSAPTANLAANNLTDFQTSASWKFDTSAGTMTVPDYDFPSGDTSLSTYWTILTGPIETATSIDANDPSLHFVRLDKPDEAMQLQTRLSVPSKSNSHYTGGSGTRKVLHFIVRCKMKRDFSDDSMLITLIGFDAGGTEIARTPIQEFKTSTYGFGATGQAEVVSRVFSFADSLAQDQISTLNILITAGPSNRGGLNGPYITAIEIIPTCARYILNPVGNRVEVAVPYVENTTVPATQTTPTLVPVGDDCLSYVLPATVQLDTTARIAIACNLFVPFASFRVQLGLRKGTGTVAAYSDDMDLVTESDGTTYLTTDLSVMLASDRQNITHLELYFPEDIATPGGYTNYGQKLFALGPLVLAGNLTVGLPYEWCYREVQNAGTSDELTSPVSDIAGTLTPVSSKAQGKIAATVPTNSLVPAVAIEWYRRGGTITDNGNSYFRLVARTPLANGSGTNWTTTYSGGVLTFQDNVPDSTVLNATTLTDHDPTPTGITTVAAFASRLAAMTGDTLYLSRISFGKSAGMYWTVVTDPLAPDYPVQGQAQRITGADGGYIGQSVVRIVQYKGELVLLFPGAMHICQGTRPPFEVRRYKADEGKGAISAPSVQVVKMSQNDEGLLVWLAPDGLRGFDGVGIRTLTPQLERVLNPASVFAGPALNASAYATSTVFAHSERMYLSAPLPGGNALATLYVLDQRGSESKWFQWAIAGINGYLTFPASNDLYILTEVGQIYQVGPTFGDKATPASALSGVPVTVKGRTLNTFGWNLQAERITAELACDGDGSYVGSFDATFVVTADEAKRWTKPYTVRQGYGGPRLQTVGKNVQGERINWMIQARTIKPLTIRRLTLELSTRRRR